MGRVRSVEPGFFPLDEELALMPGSLAPSLQEHLVHLATWMPFRRAAQMLDCLLGVQVSEATMRRQTEAAGARSEEVQTRESQQPEPEPEPEPESAPLSPSGSVTPSRLVLSADGAYVRLLHSIWAETRTLVMGEVGAHGKTHTLSYFSRMTNAERFADLAEVETRRRGLVQAQSVCAVTDGAEWLQGFIDLHRPDALRILDFAHAAQRFGQIRDAYEATEHPLSAQWVQQQCHDLKHDGPGEVLTRLRALPPLSAAQEHVSYLEKREALMQYPSYQADEWPIGSGIVESGNKVVMQARLKGAGMSWETSHVNPMLALRTAVCNDRWEEAWQQMRHEQQQQRAQRRLHRASVRLEALLADVLLAIHRARPRPTPVPVPSRPHPDEPAATLPGSSRPSVHHPWKRGPVCRPKLPAKK
jgi:hypothetical protein